MHPFVRFVLTALSVAAAILVALGVAVILLRNVILQILPYVLGGALLLCGIAILLSVVYALVHVTICLYRGKRHENPDPNL